ncbi:MAG: bis(5'-nucleosyl)-tetraphosphatase [Candidatus Paceibacteria bacterium]
MRKRAQNFKREFSAGAIIFKENSGQRRYLLLEYESEKEYWGFPKGIVEPNESPQEAAKREISEETGLRDVEFIPGFRKQIHYFFRHGNTLVSKDVIYFLCRALSDKVVISEEHKGFDWFLYEDALRRLTYNKEILKEAEQFLNEKG